MTQHERSVAAVRAVRARWRQATAEERRWTALFLRSHQPRFRGTLLPPKPQREQVTQPVVAILKPPPPQIPVVVIPRRQPVDPLAEHWKLRPAMRWNL
jgi:hypothetical protein